MSEATERPWRMSEDGVYVYSEASDRVVCDTPVGLPVMEEDEANLDLIVRAVNTHEEAIGLLREFVAEVSKAAYAPELEHLGPLVLDARALLSSLDAEGTPNAE